jgi:hypothetical protein
MCCTGEHEGAGGGEGKKNEEEEGEEIKEERQKEEGNVHARVSTWRLRGQITLEAEERK